MLGNNQNNQLEIFKINGITYYVLKINLVPFFFFFVFFLFFFSYDIFQN